MGVRICSQTRKLTAKPSKADISIVDLSLRITLQTTPPKTTTLPKSSHSSWQTKTWTSRKANFIPSIVRLWIFRTSGAEWAISRLKSWSERIWLTIRDKLQAHWWTFPITRAARRGFRHSRSRSSRRASKDSLAQMSFSWRKWRIHTAHRLQFLQMTMWWSMELKITRIRRL